MLVGIFHPSLNACGGAEFVAINIMKILKEQGYSIVVMTDQEIDRTKINRIYGIDLIADSRIIFPLALFPPTDFHNIYFDVVRCRLLKNRCDIVIDAYSNELLPGADIAYIHFPLLKRLPSNLRNQIYYAPYRIFSKKAKEYASQRARSGSKIVLANSRYTAKAIEEAKNITASVLYPPVSSFFFDHPKPFTTPRDNLVVTVSRISEEKKLETIPRIAKLTSKKISFQIIGLPTSRRALQAILASIKKYKVSDRVKISTNSSREQLREILLGSKVYLHSAVGEHFGISIAEAMASGCTPVVHDSGGPREFVSKDLRYETSEDAAQKVERAISEWSPKIAIDTTAEVKRFHEREFSKGFIQIFESPMS